MKQLKKQMLDMTEVSMLGVGSSMAIGALGGSSAGVQGATKYMGTTGKMVGMGGVMRTISSMDADFKRTGKPYKMSKGKLKGRMMRGY